MRLLRRASCTGLQWEDAERSREIVDLRQERRIERNAVLLPLPATCPASLSGHMHRLDARQRPRGCEVADVAVDLSLEQIRRHEAGYIERDDELPDIEFAAERRRKI